MCKVSLVFSLGFIVSAMSVKSPKSEDSMIREQLTGWVEAWNKGDAQSIAAFFDDDADRTFAHGTTTTGKAQILQMYENAFGAELPEGVKQELHMKILSVRLITGDVAVADYEYTATGIPILPRMVINGRSTVVMVKRQGAWLRAAQRNWIPTTPECMKRCARL